MSKVRGSLFVYVVDSGGNPRPDATVRITAQGKSTDVGFDKAHARHRAKDLDHGTYELEVAAAGLETQKRAVAVSGPRVEEVFVLGKAGQRFYYRGKAKVPFESHDLWAMSFRPEAIRTTAATLQAARGLGLVEEKVDKAIHDEHVHVFRMPANADAHATDRIVRAMTAHPSVRKFGPVVATGKRSVSFLTDEIVVRFRADVKQEAVPAIAKRVGLRVKRTLPQAGNAYVFEADIASFALLDKCEDLVQMGLVEYAEPNLVTTMVDDQVVPNDFLYPQQWHLPLINTDDAWQILRNRNAPGTAIGGVGDHTFGNENIFLAVFDRGIQSTTATGTAVARSPDFSGDVTSGDSKIVTFFDFVNMNPDNNNPGSDHGMGCAGVAAALANNPAVVAGETEGIVGAAPNCRVMACQRPPGNPEVDYSDAYIWMAGFDPHSTRAGFPAPLARGADVITNSFGSELSIGSPISGLMKDTFDFLTTYGRGGKGVVVFFSAGNGGTDFTLQRPWAAYTKGIAIAASTDAEVRAGYSNYGAGIDLCAPSSGGANGIVSADWISSGQLAGHTGGTLDYTNNFGGTSAATPLTAGIAALMLSANPTLTWIEVRELLKATAVKIDPANTDPIGQWVDLDGDGIKEFSQWYGYGRIDAQAAVNAAATYPPGARDMHLRDRLTDTGAVPVSGAFWASPDIWVRRLDPATDGAAALPADYSSAPPHEMARFGHDNWVYVRVRNRGTMPSYDFSVRIYVTHFPGTEFTYPASFIPSTRPGAAVTPPLVPGTYLIGEVAFTNLAAGDDVILNVRWPSALVPPEDVAVGGTMVHWHPCLLAEVTPHDGAAATGPHVWDDNNLAQINIQIDYTSDDFAFANVLGNPDNPSRFLEAVIDRRRLPPGIRLWVSIEDKAAMGRLVAWLKNVERWNAPRWNALSLTDLPTHVSSFSVLDKIRGRALAWGRLKLGRVNGKPVVWLPSFGVAQIPILRAGSNLVPVIVGGHIGDDVRSGTYDVNVAQVDDHGHVNGGVTNRIVVKK